MVRQMILGIEIGGTKLQLAVGSGESVEITEAIRLGVDRQAGAKGILEQIKSNAPKLINNHKINSIGIGFGGPVDTRTSTTIISHQISGWDHFQLGNWCETELGIKAAIDNDCNVAALAEANFGAGRGHRRVFYVTVGTGIGGGLVVDGNVYGGDRPAAAEIGHLRPGLLATHPHQTVESFSSGSGIEIRTRDRLRVAEKDSDAAELLALCDHNLEKIDAKCIAVAWANGNKIATETMQLATRTLGWATAQVATIAAPELIVIGGGVSLMGKPFLEAVREAFETYLFPPLKGVVEIQSAELGESVVLHGAMLLAKRAREI